MTDIAELEENGVASLLRDSGGPVFEQPWQAQAFSLVIILHKSGLFPWKDWVMIFSEEIRSSPARPNESVNDAYYRQWITALERLVASLGLTHLEAIAHRAEEWRQAYLNTPHGQPVDLTNAACPPSHSHHAHAPLRRPVAVSAARSA